MYKIVTKIKVERVPWISSLILCLSVKKFTTVIRAMCSALYCTQIWVFTASLTALNGQSETLESENGVKLQWLTWLCVVDLAIHECMGEWAAMGVPVSLVTYCWSMLCMADSVSASLRDSCDTECWVHSGCVASPTYKPIPKALASKFSQKLSAYMRVYTVVCWLY